MERGRRDKGRAKCKSTSKNLMYSMTTSKDIRPGKGELTPGTLDFLLYNVHLIMLDGSG